MAKILTISGVIWVTENDLSYSGKWQTSAALVLWWDPLQDPADRGCVITVGIQQEWISLLSSKSLLS